MSRPVLKSYSHQLSPVALEEPEPVFPSTDEKSKMPAGGALSLEEAWKSNRPAALEQAKAAGRDRRGDGSV
jgi:hypothetical protein